MAVTRKEKTEKLNYSRWPQNCSCHVLREGREETQRTVGALSGASFGGGTKGRAELTGLEVRMLIQTFTSFATGIRHVKAEMETRTGREQIRQYLHGWDILRLAGPSGLHLRAL